MPCAPPPVRVPTWRSSARMYACTRTLTVRTSRSRSTLRARVCTAAATAAPPGEAPLKENVAAGVLMRAQWPQLAAQGAEFLDPLCGSGTLCIEAALIAADRAPGLTREYFGFLGWRGHDAPLVGALRTEAEERARARHRDETVIVRGQDRDATPSATRAKTRCVPASTTGALRRRGTCAMPRRCPGRPLRPGSPVHQPPLRRAPGGPRGRARSCTASSAAVLRDALPGLARRDTHRCAGAGHGARSARLPHPHGLERRHRVPAAAHPGASPKRARTGHARQGRRSSQGHPRRTHVREPPREEPEAPARLGAAGGDLLLPALRRGHARVCFRDRPVPHART